MLGSTCGAILTRATAGSVHGCAAGTSLVLPPEFQWCRRFHDGKDSWLSLPRSVLSNLRGEKSSHRAVQLQPEGAKRKRLVKFHSGCCLQHQGLHAQFAGIVACFLSFSAVSCHNVASGSELLNQAPSVGSSFVAGPPQLKPTSRGGRGRQPPPWPMRKAGSSTDVCCTILL